MTTAHAVVRPQLTHMGINVYDVARMEAFYTTVLGLTVTDRGVGKTFRAQLVFLSSNPFSHHQVVLASGRDPQSPNTSINQISFKVADLDELRAMYRSVRDHDVAGLRPLNHGNAWSLYFLDPEGNTIEIYCDSPWYVSQPHGDPFDPEAPTEVILTETEADCRDDPHFMLAEQWRARLQAQLDGPA